MTKTKKKYKLKKSLGNPLIAAALPGMVQQATPIVNKLLNAVLLTGGAVGVYFGGRYLYRNHKQSVAEGKIGSVAEAKQASLIHKAIEGAGTDEDLLFEIAKEIKDWKKVKEFYSDLYRGTSIEDDIKGDLNDADYKKFFDLMEGKGVTDTYEKQKAAGHQTGVKPLVQDDPSKKDVPTSKLKGAYLITDLDGMRLRTKPEISKSTLIPGLSALSKGTYVGLLTGNEEWFKDKETGKVTIFLEVEVQKAKLFGGIDTKNAWIAKQGVIGTFDKNKISGSNFKERFIVPKTTLFGPDGINVNEIYITTETTNLFTPQLKEYKNVEKNTAIGIPLNEEIVDASGKHLVKFMSPQCSVLFIDKSKVKVA